MSENGDLKPCPFCGGEAAFGKRTVRRLVRVGKLGEVTGHFVSCVSCGVSNVGITEGYETPEQAAERWNTRA